jgi:hypothetical protein
MKAVAGSRWLLGGRQGRLNPPAFPQLSPSLARRPAPSR